jgi:IS5 family transposase
MIRSERMLMEQLDYNLLFRWFVGLSMDDRIWDATVFTKNRDRLLRGHIAVLFFEQVLAEARERGLTSDEHFTVDGTLVEAWAGLKSFKRKDGTDGQTPPDDPGNPTVNFHGEKRSNDTHQSTTDPDARLMTKGGQEAKLYFMGHVVMENRHGLAVGARLTHATGRAEREAAIELLGGIPRRRRISLGADKGYDVPAFVEQLRQHDMTPHVARKVRDSAIDGRTSRHLTYQVSQHLRKRVEEIFGWLKTVGMTRKVRHRGLPKGGLEFHLRLGRLQPGADTQPHCVDSMREPSTGFLTPRRCYFSYLFQNKLLQVVLEAASWLRPPRIGIAPIFSAEDRMTFMGGFSAAC